MTTRERVMVTAAVIGLMAGAALLFFLAAGGDESGIRVKNGSVYMEALTDGYTKAGVEWESKLKIKKTCFDLIVTTTPACSTPRLDYVVGVRVRDVQGVWHGISVLDRRFRMGAKGTWTPVPGNPRRLQHNNTILRINRVEALSATGDDLACEFGIDDPQNLDEILLDARNAKCAP